MTCAIVVEVVYFPVNNRNIYKLGGLWCLIWSFCKLWAIKGLMGELKKGGKESITHFSLPSPRGDIFIHNLSLLLRRCPVLVPASATSPSVPETKLQENFNVKPEIKSFFFHNKSSTPQIHCKVKNKGENRNKKGRSVPFLEPTSTCVKVYVEQLITKVF